MLPQAVRMWLIRIYRLVMGVVLVVWEFLLRVCSSAERPLHFIKVQLRVPAGLITTASSHEICLVCPAHTSYVCARPGPHDGNGIPSRDSCSTPAPQVHKHHAMAHGFPGIHFC